VKPMTRATTQRTLPLDITPTGTNGNRGRGDVRHGRTTSAPMSGPSTLAL
jgi:hypothetical protein